MHISKAGNGEGAMVRVDRKCEAYDECVGVDVGRKRRGREAEKGMVLDASCDPLWEWGGS